MSIDSGSRGASRARLRAGFMSNVEPADGHWVWIGPRDFWGMPLAQSPSRSDVMISAVVLAKMLFREQHHPGGYSKKCDIHGCVNPDCWVRGRRKPPPPQEP